MSQLKSQIQIALDNLNSKDCENLSLFSLVFRKLNSFVGFNPDELAWIDQNRANTADASLISHELSEMQKFIYTFSSQEALKLLRTRKFSVELLIEETIQQLSVKLEIPRTNIIYDGIDSGIGSCLYVLANGTPRTEAIIKKVLEYFNAWLLTEFGGKVFLALDITEVIKVQKASVENRAFKMKLY